MTLQKQELHIDTKIQDESKSISKEEKCRLQDCSQKRQVVRNQQKES